MSTPENKCVAVIGGGAAGLSAAIFAARLGAAATVFERNDRPGRKLRITGKGRCNLTNACDVNTFLTNVPRNPKFLYTALNRFSPSDTMELFEGLGVPLKVERGRRVFPVSDRAIDIVDAMVAECRRLGVRFEKCRIRELKIEDGQICGVSDGQRVYPCAAAVICTGGASYPLTGSDGDGYALARAAGHTVTEIKPSLVPLVAGGICADCQGLSLKNIGFKVVKNDTGATVFEDFGELMFAHFGLTGPVVLSASAHIPDLEPKKYTAEIDLKPALDEKTLDARLLSDFAKYSNKDFANALGDLLPQKLIAPMVRTVGIDGTKKVHSVTREERARLCECLKHLRIPLIRHRPIDEAIITSGGVDVRQVRPGTMESKLVGGLFFAGELLDLDAYTGGYNLQIAFSTGCVAGEAAAYRSFE